MNELTSWYHDHSCHWSTWLMLMSVMCGQIRRRRGEAGDDLQPSATGLQHYQSASQGHGLPCSILKHVKQSLNSKAWICKIGTCIGTLQQYLAFSVPRIITPEVNLRCAALEIPSKLAQAFGHSMVGEWTLECVPVNAEDIQGDTGSLNHHQLILTIPKISDN